FLNIQQSKKFQQMKKFTRLLGFILLSFVLNIYLVNAQNSHIAFFKDADAFLKQHVLEGKIKYKDIEKDQTALNNLLQYLNEKGVRTVSNDEEKALLINAYNLFVIKGIIDNYPISSPQEKGDFFGEAKYNLAGSKVSLDQLEKDILLPITKDARLHFVLICGALGCPKIAPYAYFSESLDAKMDERTKAALNDSYFIRVADDQSKVELSEIFTWFKNDFTRNGQTVIGFINNYRDEKLPTTIKKDTYTYDWKLNEYTDNNVVNTAPLQQGGSNLTNFTPSQLFALGQYEVQSFSTIYSQTGTRDRDGTETLSSSRLSIFTSRLSTNWGVTKSKWLNVGVDLFISGGSNGPIDNSSILQHFGGNTTAREYAITATRFVAKFNPVRKLPFFSVQLGVQVPLASNPEARGEDNVFIALNRYVFSSQFFYDLKISDKFRLFYELNGQILPKRNDQVFIPTTLIDLPSTLFVNYFPTNRINLFVMGQYAPRYGKTNTFDDREDKFGLLQSITQLGAGAKYQLTRQLGLEFSYANFVGGKGFTDPNATGVNVGNGSMLNFGIRFIK
ncbi:MAG: DUF547 domain-containing protein, partial [Bacteroidota bacterium]